MSGGNEKIKSALEIALERAQKLGSLSAEERQKLKEKELLSAAEGMAKRYLAGLPLRDLETELKRYKQQERQIVARHTLRGLGESLDIRDFAGAETILPALQHLSANARAAEGIRDLFHEYQRAMEEAWKEKGTMLEAAKRSELAAKGISGSAVDPGIETCPEWLRTRDQLDSDYQERLAQTRMLWEGGERES